MCVLSLCLVWCEWLNVVSEHTTQKQTQAYYRLQCAMLLFGIEYANVIIKNKIPFLFACCYLVY